MTNGRWQMADGGCRMADDKPAVNSGGCVEGESSESMPEVSQGRILGHDSNRVIDDSTNDKIGILSHEGMDATDRPYQGACDRQSLPSGVKTRENALALASWCAMRGRMCKIGGMVSGEIPGRGGDYPCPSIKKHAG